MTCTHINEAKKRISKLAEKLRNTDSEIYEKKGPYVHPSDIKSHTTGGFWSGYGSRATWSEWHTYIINKEALDRTLNEIEDTLDYCNCSNVANSEIKSLNNQNREERKEMLNQVAQERKSYEKMIENQSTMIETEKRENAVVRKENSGLQQMLGLTKAQVEVLEKQLVVKDGQLELSNRQIEQLRKSFHDMAVENTRNSTEARIVREHLNWTKGRLEISDNRMTEMENKLGSKQKQYETTKESLTSLQIKYKVETTNKDNELKNKDKEIKLLKNQAEKSQKELLEERLELKQEKVEEFATKLGIDLEQINKLREYCGNLVSVHKNFNQNAELNITKIKQEILNKGISIKKVQKLYRKCEKIAKIRLELGIKSISVPQFKTQTNNNNYSFGRERSWKNINSNFTSELVQEWKKYGFAYEECADWVNINPLNHQDRAIKKPAYYAWLRDVKQVDSCWVLNEGDNQQLGQEFFRWYQQQQYQALQEVIPY